MKLKFNTDEILSPLSQVVGVVNSKSPLPILGNVVFQARKDSGLTVTTSDSETWLTVHVGNVEFDEQMTFCMIAADIFKVLSNLKGKDVEMTIDKETHMVLGEYKKGHFSLPYEDANEYPRPSMDLADAIEMELNATNFLRAISLSNFAIANEKLRLIMNGIHFDFTQNGMIAAATDGQKLVKYTDKTIVCDMDGDGQTRGFTLPKKPVSLLLSLLNGYDGQVNLLFTQSCVVISSNMFKMMTRLLEGRYPSYDRVIPTDNTVTTIINKNELIEALKRVLPLGNAASELVKMSFSMGSVVISADDVNFSKSADESVDCDYASQEMSIGFNGGYLLEVLQNIESESVNVSLKEPSRAGLFKPSCDKENEEYVSLLMPIFL